MTPPRPPSNVLTIPERVAQLEIGLVREEDYGRSQGSDIIELKNWRREVEKWMAREEARDEVAREAQAEAKSAMVFGKAGVGTGIAGALYALWQLIQGG